LEAPAPSSITVPTVLTEEALKGAKIEADGIRIQMRNKSFEFIRQVEHMETITIWKLKPDTGLRVPDGLRT
jgi:hypothetical protein